MDTLPKEDIALLLILAGPAGSGKTTLCDRLVADNPNVERVVTCTTRPPREGEEDGVDYHFLSDEEFDAKVAEGAFLEWAQVHANRYGTLKSVIEEKLSQRIDLVMNIDVQGVAALQKAAQDNAVVRQRLVTLFIMPESFDELRRRLRERGQDDEAEIDRRIRSAESEVGQWKTFDYAFRSQTREADFETVRSIWLAEKRSVPRIV